MASRLIVESFDNRTLSGSEMRKLVSLDTIQIYGSVSLGHKDVITIFIAINNKYVQLASTFCVVGVVVVVVVVVVVCNGSNDRLAC